MQVFLPQCKTHITPEVQLTRQSSSFSCLLLILPFPLNSRHISSHTALSATVLPSSHELPVSGTHFLHNHPTHWAIMVSTLDTAPGQGNRNAKDWNHPLVNLRASVEYYLSFTAVASNKSKQLLTVFRFGGCNKIIKPWREQCNLKPNSCFFAHKTFTVYIQLHFCIHIFKWQ